MKKVQNKTSAKKGLGKVPVELTTRNYQLFGVAVVILIIGYIFLAQGPADSFSSLTVAPILLVIGYCILVPIAILYRRKKTKAITSSGD